MGLIARCMGPDGKLAPHKAHVAPEHQSKPEIQIHELMNVVAEAPDIEGQLAAKHHTGRFAYPVAHPGVQHHLGNEHRPAVVSLRSQGNQMWAGPNLRFNGRFLSLITRLGAKAIPTVGSSKSGARDCSRLPAATSRHRARIG